MNIVIIHAADYGGGAEACVLTLHKSLCSAGHASRFYAGYKYLAEDGVEIVPRSRPFKGALGLIRRTEDLTGIQNLYAPGFRQLLRSLPATTDIVNLHSLWGSSHYADLGGIALATRRFPTVLTLHDEWMLTGHCANAHECNRWLQGCGNCPDLKRVPAVPKDATRINSWRKRVALRAAPIWIVTVSEALKRQAESSPITAGLPIRVIYNGFDLTTFQPGSRGAARHALELPQDKLLVLLTGKTIEDVKNGRAQQGARALDILNDPRVMPLLVGHSAPEVAATLRIPSIQLPFQNSPEAMAVCYRAADITLVASEAETFGRIAAESLACGTPVICSDAGGLPEVVPHGRGGLVVQNRQVGGFADALKSLLDDSILRAQMGRAGRDWVSNHFSNEVITGQYLDLYAHVSDLFKTRNARH